jgi:hypothetical protein
MREQKGGLFTREFNHMTTTSSWVTEIKIIQQKTRKGTLNNIFSRSFTLESQMLNFLYTTMFARNFCIARFGAQTYSL